MVYSIIHHTGYVAAALGLAVVPLTLWRKPAARTPLTAALLVYALFCMWRTADPLRWFGFPLALLTGHMVAQWVNAKTVGIWAATVMVGIQTFGIVLTGERGAWMNQNAAASVILSMAGLANPLVVFGGVLVTGSRSAMLGGLTALGLPHVPRRWMVPAIRAMLAMLVVLYLWRPATANARGYEWAAALSAIDANSIMLGHGVGSYRLADMPGSDEHPDSLPIWILFEQGLVGLALFAIVIISALRRKRNPALLGILIMSLADAPIAFPWPALAVGFIL